ncbi:hypothetical protein [Streptomyces sp. NPDC086989]|uniref:hypothetical protein n=1 Tax=Streptomyces sp. NPDC086989 TaxID=3365764 RepID=UPI0037F77B5B
MTRLADPGHCRAHRCGAPSSWPAVPAAHALARGNYVDVADLRGQQWIAGLPSGTDRLMRVWPGLDERPEIVHTARDRLTTLHPVTADCGLTTAPAGLGLRLAAGGRELAGIRTVARVGIASPEGWERLAAKFGRTRRKAAGFSEG